MSDLATDLLPTKAPLSLITEHGVRAAAAPALTATPTFTPTPEPGPTPTPTPTALPAPDRLLEAYRGLVAGRRINDQCAALVRQGRIAVYPSSHGQEACQVAAAMVLGAHDWLFPTYRDTVAVIQRGVPPHEALGAWVRSFR